MNVDQRSCPRGGELTHGSQTDEETHELSHRRSSAWSTLIEDTVALLDDAKRVEAEEREIRWRVVTGRRRRRWR